MPASARNRVTPLAVSVRELVGRWGGRARGHRISQRIDADLANHGVVTTPNFRRVTLDATVSLVGTSPSAEDVAATAVTDTAVTASAVIASPELAEIGERAIGLTLGNLPSAAGGLVSVKPGATIDEAVTKMLLNDFSQLPVLVNKYRCLGAVTWRSIAQARHQDPAALLSSAVVPSDPLPYDTELLDVVGRLQGDGFVFVVGVENVVSGIVTTADVVQLYSEMSTPFFLIGELDQELRRLVVATFPFDEVCKLCDPEGRRGIATYDDLAMGDYQRVLEHPANWSTLGWPLDRVAVAQRLRELRDLRNDIMHFNPDPLPDGSVIKLRNILTMLRIYAG